MKRIVAILMMLVVVALGSGAMEYLHNLQHAQEDAACAAATAAPERADQPQPKVPVHDDSNCFLHRQLHLPTIAAGWVPVLVFLGLFVTFLSEIARPLISRPPLLDVDCRGPPAC
jgi:hypothetical protein